MDGCHSGCVHGIDLIALAVTWDASGLSAAWCIVPALMRFLPRHQCVDCRMALVTAPVEPKYAPVRRRVAEEKEKRKRILVGCHMMSAGAVYVGESGALCWCGDIALASSRAARTVVNRGCRRFVFQVSTLFVSRLHPSSLSAYAFEGARRIATVHVPEASICLDAQRCPNGRLPASDTRRIPDLIS